MLDEIEPRFYIWLALINLYIITTAITVALETLPFISLAIKYIHDFGLNPRRIHHKALLLVTASREGERLCSPSNIKYGRNMQVFKSISHYTDI
jgi:hypothetical protein